MKKIMGLALASSLIYAALLIEACSGKKEENTAVTATDSSDAFEYEADRFADLQVLRYRVNGFEKLSLQQKKLAYYLYEAALCGRDIIFDQKNKHNLMLRHVVDGIYENYKGDKSLADWKAFEVYAKQIWFSHGNHHHYSQNKIIPAFSKEFFTEALASSGIDMQKFAAFGAADKVQELLMKVVFDKDFEPKIVDLGKGIDNVAKSANNFYEGVTQKEVEKFYAAMSKPGDKTPISYGLNSKVVKQNGKLTEKVWKVGGMYDGAISKIVYWLEKAEGVAENEAQKKALHLLLNILKRETSKHGMITTLHG